MIFQGDENLKKIFIANGNVYRYILAKSSNGPLTFHLFSTKCKMTLLQFLLLEKARRVMYPRQ